MPDIWNWNRRGWSTILKQKSKFRMRWFWRKSETRMLNVFLFVCLFFREKLMMQLFFPKSLDFPLDQRHQQLYSKVKCLDWVTVKSTTAQSQYYKMHDSLFCGLYKSSFSNIYELDCMYMYWKHNICKYTQFKALSIHKQNSFPFTCTKSRIPLINILPVITLTLNCSKRRATDILSCLPSILIVSKLYLHAYICRKWIS